MNSQNLGKTDVSATLTRISNQLSELHCEVGALEDSYEQVLLVLRKFEGLCETDELTGLLRRRAFFNKWQAILNECEALNEVCGVIALDIDHFKKINDTYGHATGDEVLKRVGELLKRFESNNCVVARLGGEEFALAVRGKPVEVLAMAEMIRRGASTLSGGPKAEWSCTLSAGVATSSNQGTYDSSRLLKAADEALYKAKNHGRNQVCAA